MDAVHVACRSHVSMFGGIWQCKHCGRDIEDHEVIRPAVRLADAITIIKGDLKGPMGEMIRDGIGTVTGSVWI